MRTTIRDFQRNFRAMRERARAGEEIVIVDSEGVEFRFRAEGRADHPAFGELAADIIGAYESGQGDLASDPRHLEGYGRR